VIEGECVFDPVRVGKALNVMVEVVTAERIERRFRQGDVTAPRTARALVAALRDVPADVRRDLVIVVSELVANAVRHAPSVPGGCIGLVVQRRRGDVHVEVRDPGRGFDPTPDPGHEGGLGLVTVARVARAWGIDGGDHTTVWCDLPVKAPTEL
jgi:two-component sensor histidine kinase